MSLDTATLETCLKLKTLLERVGELVQILQEDAPYSHSLADAYAGHAENLLGLLSEALEQAQAANQGVQQTDTRTTLQALETCSDRYFNAARLFYAELLTRHTLEDLRNLAQDHPEDWSGWAGSVQTSLEECNLLDVGQALNRCLIDAAALGTPAGVRFFHEIQPVTPADHLKPVAM
jgi:hypothetical protein